MSDLAKSGGRRRLATTIAMGLGANAFGQVVTIVSQIVQLPLFLHSYGVQPTAEWFLLAAVPTYISLSDIGLSNVAANEMSLAMGRNDVVGARRMLHSLCRFMLAMTIAVSLAISVVVPAVDWASLLHLQYTSNRSAVITLVLLCVGAVVYLSSGLFYGLYRACGRGARIFVIMNAARLVELTTLLAMAALRASFVNLALGFLLTRICVFAGIWLDSAVICHPLRLGLVAGAWREVYKMLRPAVAFLAFPIGNTIYFQGTLFVVNSTLGAGAVVAYSACRVYSRAAPMLLSIVRQTVWMEYPLLFAKKEMERLRQLQRLSASCAWLIVIATVVVTIPFGPRVLSWWTHGKVELGSAVICLFILVSGVNAFWNVMSTLPVALNEHEPFAKSYLIAVTLAVGLCYFIAPHWGLASIALVLIAAELPLCYSAMRSASALSGDSLRGLVFETISGGPLISVARMMVLRLRVSVQQL